MHTAIPDASIRRKRNVARRILLTSRERLLWLWPQYFPKHDMVTGRLKSETIDTFERECNLPETGQDSEASEANPDDDAQARPEDHGEQKTQPGDYWSDPGWCKAARQYHAARGGRLLVVEIQPERLARFRQLLGDNTSLDRVWRELNERGDRPAPQATFDALLYELRTLGVAAFKNPSCRRRLADLSDLQLRELLAALIRTRARYPAITDELLIALDEIRR